MPRTLTASDHRSLIRLASTMPVGSPERKAILKGLSKTKVARRQTLKDVLKKWPEFASEIERELKKLRSALRGTPDFGRVSDALMEIQMRLEDDHRRDPAAFHARSPFNIALSDFAKAEYERKTGDRW